MLSQLMRNKEQEDFADYFHETGFIHAEKGGGGNKLFNKHAPPFNQGPLLFYQHSNM